MTDTKNDRREDEFSSIILSPQKYLKDYEGFDFDEAFTDSELEEITNAMVV